MCSSFLRMLVASLVALVIAKDSWGVVVLSGDPYTNSTPPTPDPGFYNVGHIIGSASCTYLGNGWVLTNQHCAPDFASTVSFYVDSQYQTYSLDTNFTPQQIGGVDINLFRLAADSNPNHPYPNLPTLQIPSTVPTPGEIATIVGTGPVADGNGDQTSNPDYPQTARWGNVMVTFGAGLPGTYAAQSGSYFSTVDALGNVLPNAARVAVGDSGGADFVNGHLAGIAGWGIAPLREQIIAITHTGVMGDTNADGVVDLTDLNNLLNNYGKSQYSLHPPGDVNHDGLVGIADLNAVVSQYGTSHLLGDTNGDGHVDGQDIANVNTYFGTDNLAGDAVGDGHLPIDQEDRTAVLRHLGQYLADTNGDGVVDLGDLADVTNNYGYTPTELLGDTNDDGVVDLTDLNNVLNNYGSFTTVPEPASLVLMGLGGLGLASFARRRS